MRDNDDRLERERLIAASGLFDPEWYAATYGAFLAAGEEPLAHFVGRGWQLGFDPSQHFDTRYYLLSNPDSASGDPLTHYLHTGGARRPSRRFDPGYYLAANPDVAASGMNPLAHFMLVGRAEGRLGFDPEGASGIDTQHHSPAEHWFGYHDAAPPRPVPFSRHRFLPKPPVRTIAFYLPQFHAIPENDRWWGPGFTEWTNVTRARPQFVGHYQPHLPADLGFYDLRNPEVQRRQADMAEAYGIAAFCFYFYWFAGKRLLEHPVEQFATTDGIDLPFCLCWANENWTRRWDGLDQEVLIGQKHSPDDDLAFIEYVARYLTNERYLRIDGKPLLLVYRPKLIPNIMETAERWRRWFREAGHGELYLASTRSFSGEDPAAMGLDATVEFPPINAPLYRDAPPAPLNPGFAGRLLDWRGFVAESRNYPKPDVRLFRSVCPSWDNEARRPGKGTVLMGASPVGYAEWLQNAAEDAVARFDQPDERLVFVNAWNEWAEGAHLEPDRRHGYAYLEAHRMALVKAGIRLSVEPAAPGRLAAVVHAFYPDVFEHLLGICRGNRHIGRFYITSPRDRLAELDRICMGYRLDYQLIEVENHGRDILPFLKAMARVRNDGFRYVLKLHTKKSLHRSDGDVWRDEIYDTLGHPDQTAWILKALDAEREVGLVGPGGHLLSQGAFIGSNEANVRWLMGRLGLDGDRDIDGDGFVGGSMFYARVAALEPLLALALRRDDFEAEGGQIDATLAHAIERVIAYSAEAAGFTVAEAALRGAPRRGLIRQVKTDYRFARSANRQAAE